MPETSIDSSPRRSEASGPTRRVLVIDDSVLVREAARLALGAVPGWDVLVAESGEEGLVVAQAAKPDAILLDVVMPGLDGLAVAQQLQERGLASASQVVFLTGMDGLQEGTQTTPAAAGVIAKPFALDALAGELASLLGWQT